MTIRSAATLAPGSTTRTPVRSRAPLVRRFLFCVAPLLFSVSCALTPSAPSSPDRPRSSQTSVSTEQQSEDDPSLSLDERLHRIRRLGSIRDGAVRLEKLAGNPELVEMEQLAIVDVTVDMVTFSQQKADVLLALLTNPALTEEARRYLASRIEEIPLALDRVRLRKHLH